MSQKYDISKGKHFPLVMTAFVLKDQKHIHSWLIMMLLPCSKAFCCSKGKKQTKASMPGVWAAQPGIGLHSMLQCFFLFIAFVHHLSPVEPGVDVPRVSARSLWHLLLVDQGIRLFTIRWQRYELAGQVVKDTQKWFHNLWTALEGYIINPIVHRYAFISSIWLQTKWILIIICVWGFYRTPTQYHGTSWIIEGSNTLTLSPNEYQSHMRHVSVAHCRCVCEKGFSILERGIPNPESLPWD